jgi:hypothetical protein
MNSKLVAFNCSCAFGVQRSISGFFFALIASSTILRIASARDGTSIWPRRQSSTIRKKDSETLDGKVEGSGAVFEAKFTLPWTFSEEAAAEKHMAQLQHNAWVIAARSAVLSIITGGDKWVEMTIPADPLYQHLLLTAEKKFWRCVECANVFKPGGGTEALPNRWRAEGHRATCVAQRGRPGNRGECDSGRMRDRPWQRRGGASRP